MGTSLFLTVAALVLGAPAQPDGSLVLGVAGHSPGSRIVSREWAAVADPRSGSIRKRRLAGGTLCYGKVLAVGDRVVVGGHRGRRSVALGLPLSLRGPARSLGLADTFVPAARGDSLWLGRWRGRPAGARLGLQRVGPGGEARVSAHVLGRRWSLLQAALSDAFVVSVRDSLVVWDRSRDAPLLSARGGWFLAASDTRVAWCRSERCPRIQVWSRGESRALTPPAGVRPRVLGGAFTLDGRLLATGVTVDGRTRVAVVDTLSGEWTLVPGGELGGYEAIAWSPSGRWLYFTESNVRLRAWRTGSERATALPVRPGGTVMSIDVAG